MVIIIIPKALRFHAFFVHNLGVILIVPARVQMI